MALGPQPFYEWTTNQFVFFLLTICSVCVILCAKLVSWLRILR